jgi:tRNA pseudouridine synthase 10
VKTFFPTQFLCRYVIGNYIKLCRRTCQTRWLGTEGIKQISQNVEELVSQPLLALTRARQFSFHGMGREDVDVRMYICFRRVCLCYRLHCYTENRLATGRPFVVELRDCRRPTSLTPESLDLLYAPSPEDGSVSVSVINAHTASKAERDELVKAAGTSRKTYRCVVWAARVINNEDLRELQNVFVNVELQQLTPIRVLHRRTSAVRFIVRVVATQDTTLTVAVLAPFLTVLFDCS